MSNRRRDVARKRKNIFILSSLLTLPFLHAERAIGIAIPNETNDQKTLAGPAPTVLPVPVSTVIPAPLVEPKELSEKGKDFLGYLFFGTSVKEAWNKYFYDHQELDLSQVPELVKSWTEQKDFNLQRFKEEFAASPKNVQSALEEILRGPALVNDRGEGAKMDYVASQLILAVKRDAASSENTAAAGKSKRQTALSEEAKAEEAKFEKANAANDENTPSMADDKVEVKEVKGIDTVEDKSGEKAKVTAKPDVKADEKTDTASTSAKSIYEEEVVKPPEANPEADSDVSREIATPTVSEDVPLPPTQPFPTDADKSASVEEVKE